MLEHAEAHSRAFSHVVTTEVKGGLQLPSPGHSSLVGGFHRWASIIRGN